MPSKPSRNSGALADTLDEFPQTFGAQALLGHAELATTQIYLGKPTLDDLVASVRHFSFGALVERTFYPRAIDLANPEEAPTGIEPV